MLIKAEEQGNFGKRLAFLEEFKSLPFGPIWDQYCLSQNVPVGREWVNIVEEYEDRVLRARG